MKALKKVLEGILDADYDVKDDDVYSIYSKSLYVSIRKYHYIDDADISIIKPKIDITDHKLKPNKIDRNDEDLWDMKGEYPELAKVAHWVMMQHPDIVKNMQKLNNKFRKEMCSGKTNLRLIPNVGRAHTEVMFKIGTINWRKIYKGAIFVIDFDFEEPIVL